MDELEIKRTANEKRNERTRNEMTRQGAAIGARRVSTITFGERKSPRENRLMTSVAMMSA